MKFRKKPVVIEAFQLTKETRENNSEWPQWAHQAWNEERLSVGALFPYEEGTGDGPLGIQTLEGLHRVDFGDWIIRGVKGELYPCKPDIFEMTYDPTSLPRPTGLDPSIPSPDLVGSRPISQKVDEEIRAERERQRSQWGDTRTHDVGHQNEDWAKFIDEQLDKIADEQLRIAVGGNYFFTPSYRNRLIKIAALCVAGLEAMDVKDDGGPTRLVE